MSLGAAGQVHLAGRNHGGDAAMHAAVDPAELALTRRPVTEDRVHVAIDQPGRDAGPVAVDDCRRTFGVAVFLFADRGDQAIDDDQRVGLEDRAIDITGEQETDALDHNLAGWG